MIHVEHLSKSIKGRPVLCDVSLDVPAGRIVGLVGPNGSGKTMLMRCMVGLVRPSSGSVTLNGCNPWERVGGRNVAREGAWPSIGLILETPAFLDNFTARANLELFASIGSGGGCDDIGLALESVGLDPADCRTFRSFSLGMRQRLGIACALLGDPELLVLDEPTNALDAEGVARVTSLIERAARRGATVVLASHDAAVMEGLADEVWSLAEGHVENHWQNNNTWREGHGHLDEDLVGEPRVVAVG